ncbi:MAG TPA: hypothetical protein VGN08_01160 [Solirubrobacteraceae bacterium]|jgi:hypothetical protein
MRAIRIAGLCLLAVGAWALSAAAASAEPEFLTKAVVAEGSKIPFSATVGAAFLEGSKSKSKISCTGGSGSGEVTGPKSVRNDVTTFTGCSSSELKCKSGTTEGVIVTKPLQGVLGGVTSTLPGVRLFSQSEGRGGKLAEFECGASIVKVVVTGSVIGSLSGAAGTGPETGKLLTSGKLTFQEAGGLQKYTKFLEGEAGSEQLTATINGSPELSGQSVIATLQTVPVSWGMGVTK